jgi:hypothetical protein
MAVKKRRKKKRMIRAGKMILEMKVEVVVVVTRVHKLTCKFNSSKLMSKGEAGAELEEVKAASVSSRFKSIMNANNNDSVKN